MIDTGISINWIIFIIIQLIVGSASLYCIISGTYTLGILLLFEVYLNASIKIWLESRGVNF
jgi:hypothetical protein